MPMHAPKDIDNDWELLNSSPPIVSSSLSSSISLRTSMGFENNRTQNPSMKIKTSSSDVIAALAEYSQLGEEETDEAVYDAIIGKLGNLAIKAQKKWRAGS